MVYHAFRALGVRVTIRGNPPPPASRETGQTGVLFICSHRTLLDPIFLSTALGRPITAVTYSVLVMRLLRDAACHATSLADILI
jgi:1-acyl-sn-glycerol-3-phosphate acyltransferase